MLLLSFFRCDVIRYHFFKESVILFYGIKREKEIFMIASILEQQRAFFKTNETKNVDIRIHNLKILKNAIQKSEEEITKHYIRIFIKHKWNLT